MITVVRDSATSPVLIGLVRMLDAYLNECYGTLQSTYDQYNSLASVDGAVIASIAGRPVGCGCFKRFDDDAAEIKRMFVRPENRGSGAASKILSELESWVRELGYVRTVLETGIKQVEAIRFYDKSGYSRIENYGQYAGMATSICMAKKLRDDIKPS
jgi:putative acetyltransferase